MLDNINNFLWIIATIMIFGAGIYFSFKIKFAHFNLKEMFKALKSNENEDGISAMQTLTMNLAARIGVGSISGIALAIYLGGVGTIFWMWISCLIASANTFLESVLSVIFQEKDTDKIYKGGPSYYIDSGLKKKRLAKIYAVLIILAYIVGFLTIQSNTITIGIVDRFNVNPIVIGIIIAVITGLVIVKGVKNIANVTNFLVPFMGIIYFIICLIIIGINYQNIPSMLASIVTEAFNFKALGFGVLSTFLIGIQRGIFSNEAGIGTGAIASATTKTSDPSSQGFIQSFGVYIDTLVIGTLTALVVMCCNFTSLNLVDANGIEIAKYAFAYYLGDFGSVMLIIIISLFAFSTIITGYYYGESSLKYIMKDIKPRHINFLKVITLGLLVLGSIMSSSFIWELIDIFVALLAIINIYALWKLKKIVFENLKKRKKL